MYDTMSESPLYSSGTMKRVLQELNDLKFRLSKVEDEVATLHELVGERNNVIGRRSFSLSPSRILEFEHSLEDDDLRWSHELPRNNFETDSSNHSKARSVAMMMHNQAWYGDAFLYEAMCQVRKYRPRENNWFNSIFPFRTVSSFHQFIQSQKWFHHTCVLSIGYSDLFRFQSLDDKRVKWLLHQILNHMRDFGADRIKVLSIPPARQMMKNAEYLRLCQANNRALQTVTETHRGVDFINLDSFFLKNSDESFTYFENDEISIEILDNLLMKKVEDKFSIYIDPETAQCLLEHVTNYKDSSNDLPYISRRLKGCDPPSDSPKERDSKTRHDFEDRSRGPLKRRRDDSYYEGDGRSLPEFRGADRRSPSASRRESPRRGGPNHFRRHSPNKFPELRSPKRRDSRYSLNDSRHSQNDSRYSQNDSRFSQNKSPPPSNHSQSSKQDLREDLRRDRRSFTNQKPSEAVDVPANKSIAIYKESASRSKRRDDETYEERIVSKSTTEIRLVRYGERKSSSPHPPPPWLKNVAPALMPSSSKSDRYSPSNPC